MSDKEFFERNWAALNSHFKINVPDPKDDRWLFMTYDTLFMTYDGEEDFEENEPDDMASLEFMLENKIALELDGKIVIFMDEFYDFKNNVPVCVPYNRYLENCK